MVQNQPTIKSPAAIQANPHVQPGQIPRRSLLTILLMFDQFQSLIGPSEAEPFAQALRGRPAKSIRPRVDRTCQNLPFATAQVPWFPAGLKITGGLKVTGGLNFTHGAVRPGGYLQYAAADYYIQDAASMLPLAMLKLDPDDWVCDLCAAPGGKASAIAERLGTHGFLLANEVIASRLDVLHYTLARTGRANFLVSNSDPQDLAVSLAGQFDKVLVDVPCSGQSLVARKQQTQSSFAENHVEHCAARALRILQCALQLVRPGGLLVFSTCTFAIQENEAQVAALLETYRDSLSPGSYPELEPWRSPLLAGCYRLWPHRDDCAGGFAAAIELSDPIEPTNKIAQTKSTRTKTTRDREAKTRRTQERKPKDRSKLESVEPMLELGEFHLQKLVENHHWLGYEPGAFAFVERFGHRLGHGLQLARIESKRIEPYHGLSMLLPTLFTPAHRIELDTKDAKSYLIGNAIARGPTDESLATPWSVACWNRKPLGWLKAASNRWNNYLPAWARFTSFSDATGDQAAHPQTNAWPSDDEPPE